jgi:nickel superoxide dismutase
MMIYRLVAALDRRFGFERAKAHCDIPCGIYDPSGAQIAALTVVRMMDLIADLESKGGERNAAYLNTLARYVAVKEEHAEKAKHEIRVIWGDYIKPQHLDKHPEAHEVVYKIMQLGSKSRQTTDRDSAVQLVEAINQFAMIFWDTKGIATKRAKAPYAPSLEMIYPVL